MPVVLRGMRELQAAFARADRDTKTFTRKALADVAEPIRGEAEGLATSRIPRIGPRWGRMRVGVTRTVVYVAPREKGARKSVSRRRPRFGTLLMERAMEPALEKHEADVEHRLDQALELMADRFNRGGTL